MHNHLGRNNRDQAGKPQFGAVGQPRASGPPAAAIAA